MNYARVSVFAVEQFKTAVNVVSGLSLNLAECESTMTELYSCLDELSKQCEISLEKLRIAMEQANGKKEKYDALVNQFTAEKEIALNELQSIRAKLATTPMYLTEKDSEGRPHRVRNPEFDALKEEEDAAEHHLSVISQNLSEAHAKLEKTKAVIYKVISLTKEMSNAHKQLCAGKEQCRKIQSSFTEIKTKNKHQTDEALETLSNIIYICNNYIDLQIKHEALQPVHYEQSVSVSSGIDFNVSESGNNFKVQEDEQTIDKSSRVIQHTDDNGQVYRINDELVKNTEFQINGYTYKTDSDSRTIQASGKLKIPAKHDREMELMHIVGKGDQRSSDDRGHLIGHQFFGSDRLENLVPQEHKINQGSYARLELHLAELVNSGNDVYVSVIPFYRESRRPEAIFYYYCVNGHSSAVFFTNNLPEEML